MSLITRSQVTTRRTISTAGARSAQALARGQARAAAQAGPFARNVQVTARDGVYSARLWMAPRLERSAHVVQDRAAPRVSALLSAAARQVEPPRAAGARRWPRPTLMAVIAAVAGGGTAAAVLLGRRGSGPMGRLGRHSETSPASGQDENVGVDATPTDVNRHAHTP